MSKRRILLADDSITIQKVVNLTFADEGIEVVSVGDGDSAMKQFVAQPPDLVLADVNMPGLDGYRICEMIKQDDETKDIPVILLVGSFEPFDEDEAARVGADDYLTKPFQSIRQLVTKVSDLLNGNKVGNANAAETFAFASEQKLTNLSSAPLTGEFPRAVDETPAFDDAVMDDEMIETSQVGGYQYDETPKYSVAAAEPARELDTSDYNEESSDDYDRNDELTSVEYEAHSTEEFSAPEYDTEKVYTLPAQTEETESVFEYQDADESASSGAFGSGYYEFSSPENVEKFVAPDADEPVNYNYNPADSLDQSESAANGLQNQTTEKESDSASEFTGESVEKAANDEENVGGERSESGAEVEQGGEFDSRENAASGAHIPQPEAASALEFDDSDLLELPPIESRRDKVQPSETVAAPIAAETVEPVPEEKSADAQTNETSEPSVAAEFQLTPAMIEAIAQKVAEKISDRTIKEIAREVVPQMTDLFAKKISEENEKLNAGNQN